MKIPPAGNSSTLLQLFSPRLFSVFFCLFPPFTPSLSPEINQLGFLRGLGNLPVCQRVQLSDSGQYRVCCAGTLADTHTHWYSHYSLLPVVQRGPWVPLGENSSWMLSTLTQTCLSIPQFGSCSSFGTFRPAFSHTGTIIRPLSVILPASPTFKHSPGSNTPSPTSKVPSWKVCFHLQFYFWLCSL